MIRSGKCFLAGLLLCYLTSCTTYALRKMGAMENSAELKKAGNGHKEIVFVPMHHIGTRPFYDDVKSKIDSLRNSGYLIYFEGVNFSNKKDPQADDTLAMKIRRVSRVDLRAMKSNDGYIDTLTSTFMGRKVKAIKKYKLVNQPRRSMYDLNTDRNVDAYMSDAVAFYEEKYEPIPLTEYDYNTPASVKYTAIPYKKNNVKKIIMEDFRNEYITNEIAKDEHTKIALVYGAKHCNPIIKGLQKLDSTWKLQ